MNSNSIKILAFILLLAFFCSLLVFKIKLPVDDLGRHLKNGELLLKGEINFLYSNDYSYTAPDSVFINHHWLSGVVFYLAAKIAGFSGLVILKVFVLLSTFSLLFFTALKKADFWLVALFSLPTILILKERAELRPEIFSYLFIAVFLFFLFDLENNSGHKRIFWLAGLQLLWVNLHIFFPIGILLVGGFLAEKMILNRKNLKGNSMVKKLALLLAALIAVSFANPNTLSGVIFPFQIFHSFNFVIGEAQSVSNYLRVEPPWADVSANLFAPAVFVLAFSFLFGFWRKSFVSPDQKSSSPNKINTLAKKDTAPIFYFFASAGSAVAAFPLIRNLPLFGLMFLPAVCMNFNGIFSRLKNRLVEKILIIFLICMFSFMIFLALRGSFLMKREAGIGLTRYSTEAAAFFEKQKLQGPIFNDFDSGSYLIYNLFPKEKVFVDGRPEAYPETFFSETYSPIFLSDERWKETAEKYDFNAIFFHQYDETPGLRSFLSNRMRDPDWALVYADIYFVIFLKNNPQNQDTIAKFQITQQNIVEKLDHLSNSIIAKDQIAAADLFNLMGLYESGMSTFQRIVERWPNMGRIWMILGQMELSKNPASINPVVAEEYLKKAIANGQGTAETYAYLGLAYFQSGQYAMSQDALKKSLEIDPDRADAKNLLPEVQKYLN